MPGSKRRALKKLLSPTSSASSTPNQSGTSLSQQVSGTSIASNPDNYMSDEALQQDLAVEEMLDREKSIGSGTHRAQDGVLDLAYEGGASGAGMGSVPPPPPPAGGGMYAPQQMTAEALMFGDEGGGGGGKKKSSKQRHAERQVSTTLPRAKEEERRILILMLMDRLEKRKR